VTVQVRTAAVTSTCTTITCISTITCIRREGRRVEERL
jgi:hypothetical protein